MEDDNIRSTAHPSDQPSSIPLVSCISMANSSKQSSPVPAQNGHGEEAVHARPQSNARRKKKKPAGWRAMPYILGNDSFERLASFGLLANFMVYLTRELHLEQVAASNILNLWSGLTNFAPLAGAFISDVYAGRFRTIAFASFASLLGMLTITLTAWVKDLHPPPCTQLQLASSQCVKPNNGQLGVLILGLAFLSIGSGGIRPCSIPFGVDQFDPTTDEGRKGVNSFFNWYYTTFTIVLLISQTLVVYIQDSVSWKIGFGIPTLCMFFSIILFFFGSRVYTHVKPDGSTFSSVMRVIVAAYKKRKVQLPVDDGVVLFYDPPLKETVVAKLPLTTQFKCLNRAAVILEEDEVREDGACVNEWRLCSIQEVEELKCVVRIIPIWASGIISLVTMTQQGTFTISQALKMDRHIGPKFQIPAGSMGVISLLTIGVWVPFYDRVMVPALRRMTKHETGITLLQRTGVGIVFSSLAMVVAGLIERARRDSANMNPNPLGIAPMSVMWLTPQLILMGMCEAFNMIGLIEFFNRQFPDHMRSIANALFSLSFAGASYLSSLIITIVHQTTKTRSKPDWLTNDINKGRVDLFYYVVAAMGVLNFVYFLYCSSRYQYKGTAPATLQFQDKLAHHKDEDDDDEDVELAQLKSKEHGVEI